MNKKFAAPFKEKERLRKEAELARLKEKYEK